MYRQEQNVFSYDTGTLRIPEGFEATWIWSEGSVGWCREKYQNRNKLGKALRKNLDLYNTHYQESQRYVS